MRVFNAFRQAFDCYQIASDPGRDVGQIWKGRDHVDFLLGAGHAAGDERQGEGQRPKTITPYESHQAAPFHIDFGLFPFGKPMRVAAEERGPLEEELVGILSIPAIGAVVLQTQSLEFAGEPRQVRRPRAVVRSMAGRVERGCRQASEWIRDEQRRSEEHTSELQSLAYL